VGPDRIVVTPPALDDDLCLVQRLEDLSIQKFVAQRCCFKILSSQPKNQAQTADFVSFSGRNWTRADCNIAE
jgi:hypothetical protein